MKKKKTLIGLSLTGLLVLSGAAIALADNSTPPSVNQATQKISPVVDKATPNESSNKNNFTPNNPNSYGVGGYGMMGGMMGGYGGPNGAGGYGMMGGMMGGGYDASSLGVNLPNGVIESADQAIAIAKAFVEKTNMGLTVDKLIEYTNTYEVKLKDAKTGENAYEFTISKNGIIYPQMGPKMMYNSRYGHMNWGNNAAPNIDAEKASQIAKDYINQVGEGFTIGKVETGPGYYEFIVQKDGKAYTELDVSAYNGQIWLENWNGPIINVIEAQ